MLGLILSSVTKWIKAYKDIAKTSPFYVFGNSNEDFTVFTETAYLDIPEASSSDEVNKSVVFDYRNLIINRGCTLSIRTPITPVIIRCSQSITINGQLSVSNISSAYATSDDQTTYELGKNILKGVKFNYKNDSIDPQTFSIIKAYATNNILTNCEVCHTGNAKYLDNATAVEYPAKGGMVVLYYNTLHNSGNIHANGSTLTSAHLEDTEDINYGGGTIILCAPIINIGVQGSITADGGNGKGCVATLNVTPEQYNENNTSTAGKLTAYISSIPATKDNGSVIEEPVFTNLTKLYGSSLKRHFPVRTTNVSYVFLPNLMTTNAVTSNMCLYLDPVDITTDKIIYISNATRNTYDVFNYRKSNAPLPSLKPVTGYTLIYTAASQTWDFIEDDTLDANIFSISGDGLYKLSATPDYDNTIKKMFSYSFSLESSSDVTFRADPLYNLQWELKIYLSKTAVWPMTGSNYAPKIFAKFYKNTESDANLICTTETKVVDDTTSSNSVQLGVISEYDLAQGNFVEPTEVVLHGSLPAQVTIGATDRILAVLYLQLPEYPVITPPPFGGANYNTQHVASNNNLIAYIGNYAPSVLEYYTDTQYSVQRSRYVSKGPYLSTITTSQSDLTNRGGAGLCIGVQLPKVY